MKNILLIGDPHFKISNKLETDQLFEETKKYLDKINLIDFIVVLGDILDTHEKVHVQPLCRSILFIKMLSSYKKTFILIGNHDRINNNVYMTEEHPFTSLKKSNENIVIVDKTLTYQDFMFVPYVPNGRFKESLKEEWENKIAIFAHQEFKGCKMGAIISEDGDVWEEDNPPVFSGHIHDYQVTQKNICYTGTPFQHSFGDNGDKGIFLLRISDKDQWNLEKIKLDIVKKKIVKMNISEFEDFMPQENCLVKVELEGDPLVIKKILEKKKNRDKINKYNLKIKIFHSKILKNNEKIEKSEFNFNEKLKKRIEKCNDDVKNTFNEIF